MFEPAEKEEWNPVVLEMIGWGIGGYALIVLLLSVPTAILIFPLTKWERGASEKSE